MEAGQTLKTPESAFHTALPLQWDRVRKCMKGTECGNQRTQEGLLYVDDAYCSAEPAVDF